MWRQSVVIAVIRGVQYRSFLSVSPAICCVSPLYSERRTFTALAVGMSSHAGGDLPQSRADIPQARRFQRPLPRSRACASDAADYPSDPTTAVHTGQEKDRR